MAFLFGGGAFATPVGQLIERATDNSASAGDLPLHLEICDQINSTDNGPRDAVNAIRKRFTGSAKNFHIINLTLTVLETCVKNCGIRFHTKIAQKDFLSDLLKVINPKNAPPEIVRDRILGLIQYWAEAFKTKPQLAAVQEVYQQLKSEGTEFPPIDLDTMAPVETPNRGRGQLTLTEPTPEGAPQQPAQTSRRQRQPRAPAGPLHPEQVAKLLSELDVVRRNIDLMNEIMVENEPGKESREDAQLLEELNKSVHSMQVRVSDLIGRVADEIILEALLMMNDDLNSVFVRYERFVKNRDATLKQQASPQHQIPPDQQGELTTMFTGAPATVGISYPSLDEPPPMYSTTNTTMGGGEAVGQLIDLGFDLPAAATSTSTSTTTTSMVPSDDITLQLAALGISSQPAPQSVAALDEFDMFAQSRTAYSLTSGSTYADNMVQQNASLTDAMRGSKAPVQTDQTFENLQQWLKDTPGGPVPTANSTAESVTSAEFDQFLAQRALKADETAPLASRPRPKMQQKAEDASDELFSL
ncbi:hypothetical protein EMCRGX_G027512 [Ephydatia muelleri]|eukprot:Em0020g1053a